MTHLTIQAHDSAGSAISAYVSVTDTIKISARPADNTSVQTCSLCCSTWISVIDGPSHPDREAIDPAMQP